MTLVQNEVMIIILPSLGNGYSFFHSTMIVKHLAPMRHCLKSMKLKKYFQNYILFSVYVLASRYTSSYKHATADIWRSEVIFRSWLFPSSM